MRLLFMIALAVTLLAGCDQGQPAPVQPPPPVPPAEAPPAAVEIGGPRGGIHVDDPANGTHVEVGGGKGVRVTTPESKVEVP